MSERSWMSGIAPRWSLLACVSMALAACNPDPRGQCESSTDCRAGSSCNLQDHLCESADACATACDAGFSCALGTCVAPGQPAVRIEIAQNALLSPSADDVQVAIAADSSVVLGALSLSATALDGGLFASGMVSQASADGGVQLTTFTSDAQGAANLLATLSYTNSSDAGTQTVSSAAVPVRVDAVPPALAFTIETASDQVDNWFPATADGGIFIDLTLDDTANGSGPDGGALVLSSCAAAPQCDFSGVLEGSIVEGEGTYRFSLPRQLNALDGGTAPFEGSVAFSIDGLDNAGNHVDKTGTVLIDGKAPVTDQGVTVVANGAGFIGEDGQRWFPAGTNGIDLEITLGATDNGVGLDASKLLLTINSADIDSGANPLVTGVLLNDGKVHFSLPTGRASNREGPMRFTVTVADKLGHQATPVNGQILVDDLPPTVSIAAVDYSDATISPKRSAVCAATVTCGRGPLASPDRALRDDLVTATFSVLDCGVGVDTGALPTVALTVNGVQGDYIYSAQAAGTGAKNQCANGSANNQYLYSVQIDLAADALALNTDLSGLAQVLLQQVAFDFIGGEGFSPVPNPAVPSAGGVIEVTRVRWQAALDGRATGAPALLPLTASQTSVAARKLVVPVDGALTPARPDGLELFDGTGALLNEVQLTSDNSNYDHATGDVAVGASGSIWIAGTPATTTSCGGGLVPCTNLWVARRDTSVALAACPAQLGAIGSLAIRDSGDAGSEVAVAGISDGGTLLDIASSFTSSGSSTISCAQASTTGSGTAAGASGISLAQGLAFVANSGGFYSVALDGSGNFSDSSTQSPFTDSASGDLLALPAAPSFFVPTAASALPDSSAYFAAVDSLSSPSQGALREALFNTCSTVVLEPPLRPDLSPASGTCWTPAPAPWDTLSLSVPVLHTPVFDSSWLYTVDEQGTLQLSSLAPSSNQITTLTAGALTGTHRGPGAAGGNSQHVSPPILLEGTAAGSSALLVQANGLVTLSSVIPHNGNGSPTLELASVLQVGTFASSAVPPAPVADVRGTGSVVYVVDGASCSSGTACTAASVWALQLDVPPLLATTQLWPRPGHDSCNSHQAEGSCP